MYFLILILSTLLIGLLDFVLQGFKVSNTILGIFFTSAKIMYNKHHVKLA